jgi:hypothetical protein
MRELRDFALEPRRRTGDAFPPCTVTRSLPVVPPPVVLPPLLSPWRSGQGGNHDGPVAGSTS